MLQNGGWLFLIPMSIQAIFLLIYMSSNDSLGKRTGDQGGTVDRYGIGGAFVALIYVIIFLMFVAASAVLWLLYYFILSMIR